MLTGWLRRALHPGELARQARAEYVRAHDLAERLSAGTEVLTESAQFLERTASSANDAIGRLESVLAGGLEDVVAASPRLSDAAVRGFVDGKPADLTPAAAQLLEYASGATGFAAQAGLWFKPSVTVRYGEGDVRVGPVTERIVEVPFALGELSGLPTGAVVAVIGAAESTLALSLASLGYLTVAVDRRGYPLTHPNLTSVASTLVTWEREDASVDAIVCLSGFGLDTEDEVGDAGALNRTSALLKPDGLLVLTVPAGRWAIDATERTYDNEHLDALLEGWRIESSVFVARSEDGTWTRQPTTEVGDKRGVMLVTARA